MVERKWIGINEYMPTMQLKKTLEEGGRDYLESNYVLVWDGRRMDVAQAVSDETGVYWLDKCSEVVKVLFWMTLPTPPEQ